MSIVRSRGAFRPSYPFGCKVRLFSRRIAVNVLAWGPRIYMARSFLNRVASPGGDEDAMRGIGLLRMDR